MGKEKGYESLQRHFVGHPLTQYKKRFSASDAAGSIELSWRRGEQSGIFQAYKDLRKKFPQAAKYLLEIKKMNKQGDIEL